MGTWSITGSNFIVNGTYANITAVTGYDPSGYYAGGAIIGWIYQNSKYNPLCMRLTIHPTQRINKISVNVTHQSKVAGYDSRVKYYAAVRTSWPTITTTGTQLSWSSAGTSTVTLNITATSSDFYLYLWGVNASTTYIGEADINITKLASPTGTRSYAVSYANGGHGTAPAAQEKVHGTALTLRSFISAQTGTASNYTITGNANGNTWSGSNGSATRTPKYTQSSWKATDGTTYSSGGSYTANAATTMTAQWGTSYTYTYTLPTGTPSKAATTSSCTVTFNANGGSTTKTSQNASRTTSYTFKGWFTASSGGTQRTTSSQVSASETVYAQMNSSTTAYGSVTLPTTSQCTRAGYKLLGFSTSSTATSASYNPGASYTPTAAITLYAVWQAYKVTMTFHVNGGSITTGTETTRYRASSNIVQRSTDSGSTWSNLTSTLATDSSTGYVDLWNVSTYGATKTGHHIANATAYRVNSATGTIINQQTTSTTDTNAATIQNLTGSATLTSDVSVVLYINWTADTYTVSYNANGHPGTAPSSQTKTYGTNLTLRAFIADSGGTDTTVTITGNANGNTWSGSNGNAHYNTTKYTQNYWNTASDGSGTNYASQGTYSTNAAATMYARFTTTAAAGTSYTLPTGTPSKASTNRFSFTVDYNANGGASTPPTQQSSITTSYTFKGWFTASSGGTQRTTSSRVTAAETVYAQMNSTETQNAVTLASAISKDNSTESGYTVTFNANNGITTKSSEIAIRTLSWTFYKWALNSPSGTAYSPGDSYTPSANCTMYATWNSSIISEGNVTLPTASECTRSGYTLLGFSTDQSAIIATYAPGATYTPTAAIILYAIWALDLAPIYVYTTEWGEYNGYYYENGWQSADAYIWTGSSWEKYT